MEAFLTMNDNDLRSLGIKHITHRKQILDAIRELNVGKTNSVISLLLFFKYIKSLCAKDLARRIK